jgi:hypothetical protein
MDFVAFRTDLGVFMIFFQCNHGSDRDSERPLPYRRQVHPLRKRNAVCWGDEEISEIERDKLSLPEVKGHLKDHMPWKDSTKLYFLLPGKELADGLVFLHTDSNCMQMADRTDVGGFAEVYVEYHGEEDIKDSSSCSDFEDEMLDWTVAEDQPDAVISVEPAEPAEFEEDQPHTVISAEPADSEEDEVFIVEQVLVLDCTGVITQIINIPVKRTSARRTATDTEVNQVENSQIAMSQICDPSQGPNPIPTPESDDLAGSDSEEDLEYVAHSEDSGEDLEVLELRKHARKFKKRMRDTKIWIGRDSGTAVPIDLIANMEELLGEEEKD